MNNKKCAVVFDGDDTIWKTQLFYKPEVMEDSYEALLLFQEDFDLFFYSARAEETQNVCIGLTDE